MRKNRHGTEDPYLNVLFDIKEDMGYVRGKIDSLCEDNLEMRRWRSQHEAHCAAQHGQRPLKPPLHTTDGSEVQPPAPVTYKVWDRLPNPLKYSLMIGLAIGGIIVVPLYLLYRLGVLPW